jgi:polysaccharide export outer membrane protein
MKVRKLSLTRRFVVGIALPLGGCAGFLPESGPRRGVVANDAAVSIGDIGNQEKLPYALVRVSSDILRQLVPMDRTSGFSEELIRTPPSGGTINIGDVLAITVFEAAAGGLFIPSEPGTRTGNYVNLPPQEIDKNGNILVPFAGTVRAAGMSTQGLADSIKQKFGDRAIEPQVIVTISDRRANAISVTGDVGTSTRFVLPAGGERILGSIARAGGPKYQPYETKVTLQRGNRTESAMFSEIMRNPAQNVQLAAGDTVLVSKAPRYYLALGALGPGQYLGLVNRRLAFEDNHLSLADGIAKVGGLSDDRANARAVFVYRFEPRGTIVSFGGALPPNAPPVIPTVYYLDLADAAGYFFATQFSMRDEDLIYVSNSPYTDLSKFLALILPSSYSAANFKAL